MGLDSVALVSSIESYFGIRLENQVAASIVTVQDMVDAVANQLGIVTDTALLKISVMEKVHPLLVPQGSTPVEWTSALKNYLSFDDKAAWKRMESQMGLHLPRPLTKHADNNLWTRFWDSLAWMPRYDAGGITVGQWVDAIAAANYRDLIDPAQLQSRYEIMVAISGITCETMGVDYFEIAPDKQFARDLGLD